MSSKVAANFVSPDKQLNRAADVPDVRKNCLAHFALGHEPAGDGHVATLHIIFLGRAAPFAGGELVGKWINSKLSQRGKIFQALLDQLIGVIHGGQMNTD